MSWFLGIKPRTSVGDMIAHLIFEQSGYQDSDHNQQGQTSQTLGGVQPHGADLNRVFDEVNGLLDVDLGFILDTTSLADKQSSGI